MTYEGREYSPDLLKISTNEAPANQTPPDKFLARTESDWITPLPDVFRRIQLFASSPSWIYYPLAVLNLSKNEGAGTWMEWKEIKTPAGRIVSILATKHGLDTTQLGNRPLELIFTLCPVLGDTERRIYGRLAGEKRKLPLNENEETIGHGRLWPATRTLTIARKEPMETLMTNARGMTPPIFGSILSFGRYERLTPPPSASHCPTETPSP